MNYFDHEFWVQELKSKDIVSFPIIFLHGIAGKTSDWYKTVHTIANENFYEMFYLSNKNITHNFKENNKPSLWIVSYYSSNILQEMILGDLTLYSLRLKAMIDKILELTNQKKVILIAHSMGGLVARKYMTLEEDTWNSVHKVLTIATPHNGVNIPASIGGHLSDLQSRSKFFNVLDSEWSTYQSKSPKKWGVIGSIDKKSFWNLFKGESEKTDSGGLGFVAISSVIPYSEWKFSVGENIEKEFFNTEHFGYRLALYENHVDLLHCQGTFQGILWAIKE